MSKLVIQDLDVSYHDVPALRNIDLTVEDGEFCTIVGPTNAGKSTLLKTVAGLVKPDKGAIFLNDKDLTGKQPKDRNLSLLFQNIALFPNLTGFENIAFPLRTAGATSRDIQERVLALSKMLRVDHVIDRLPRTFSGGEQQRVAIGRAIAKQTDLLMLDEPLTNLDARIRIALRVEFKKIHRKLAQTLLYVTHDQVEAMSMSDRIAVLDKGQLLQVGTPDEIYNRPASRFVAEFFGTPPMNIVSARVSEEGGIPQIVVGEHSLPMPELNTLSASPRIPDAIALGVRSENIRVSVTKSPETPHQTPILWLEKLGAHSILDLKFGSDTLRVKVMPDDPVCSESLAWFGFNLKPDQLLDATTGKFLR